MEPETERQEAVRTPNVFAQKYPDLFVYRESQFTAHGFTPSIDDLIDADVYSGYASEDCRDYTFWGIDVLAATKALEAALGRPMQCVRFDPDYDTIVWFFFPEGAYAPEDDTWKKEVLDFIDAAAAEEHRVFQERMQVFLETEEGKAWLQEAHEVLRSCVREKEGTG